MNDRFPLPVTPSFDSPCSPCGSCCPPAGLPRRQTLQRLAVGALGLCGASTFQPARAAPALSDPPRAGDLLVSVDADTVVPLTAASLKLDSKQLIAWPVDPATMKARDGSRLNRILLIKLDIERMDAATRARAAEGVLAYSAICTHQGCDVSSWRPVEKTLLCFCHFSQFQPVEGAAVVAGPSPRALPSLPLRSDGTRLLLAGGFNETPGGMG